MLLFVALFLIPLTEIWLFISVGGALGTPVTLGIVVATAVLGAWALQRQWRAPPAAGDPRSGRFDLFALVGDRALIALAAVLLMTPGFFTDIVGFALLVPPIRRWTAEAIRRRMKVESFMASATTASTGPAEPEADLGRRTTQSPNDDPSPWRRDPDATPNKGDVDDAIVLDEQKPR